MERPIYNGIIAGLFLVVVFIAADMMLPDSYNFSFNVGPLFVWIRW